MGAFRSPIIIIIAIAIAIAITRQSGYEIALLHKYLQGKLCKYISCLDNNALVPDTITVTPNPFHLSDTSNTWT